MAFSLILICARVFITVLKIKSIIYIILPVYTAENLKLLITTYLPDETRHIVWAHIINLLNPDLCLCGGYTKSYTKEIF